MPVLETIGKKHPDLIAVTLAASLHGIGPRVPTTTTNSTTSSRCVAFTTERNCRLSRGHHRNRTDDLSDQLKKKINAERPRNYKQFDHIDPALTALIFRREASEASQA